MKSKLFYKAGISIIALFLVLFFSKCKHTETENETIVPVQSTLQEQKDWEELNKYMTLFYKDSNEEQEFNEGTFWYRRKFEDKLMRNRLKLTRSFLKDYPESEHYFDVLKYYFTYLPEPRFIDFTIPENKEKVLDQKTKFTQMGLDMNQNYHQFRTLPYNSKAINQWIEEGNSLVEKFINSNAPEEQKAKIEVGRLGRNLRMAINYYQYLFLNKTEEENDFWFLFDRYFWGDLINQMDQLIIKYPNYSQWPTSVDQIISTLTQDYLSPELTEYYWEHYKNVTDNPELFDEHPVLAKVHEKAVKNLQAMEVLKTFDKNQPLQMKFTSMHGEKIDLKDYRGKVVLIDFWSIRCGPCIKEMPHIRAMYDKYKDQGFEVIGNVAEGDGSKERIREIINNQGVNWPQLLDGGSDVVVSYQSLYNIHSWPATWLLNKEGVVVDKYARGDRLEPLIKKYLE